MRQKSGKLKEPAEKAVKDIRRATRKRHSSEEKIRIVLEGLSCEVILEKDPRSVEPDAIKDIVVSETWMDGNLVYKAQ